MSYITDTEKEAMKKELPSEFQYLCPDTNLLTVGGFFER